MLLSNSGAASVFDEFDVQGVTDVTGFGLAGHLLEMLRASRLRAVIRASDIQLLPGTTELIHQGVESTLAPANRAVENEIQTSYIDELQKAQDQALFDPQTSGGLLMGVPEQNVNSMLNRLEAMSDVPASVIGHVLPEGTGQARLTVV